MVCRLSQCWLVVNWTIRIKLRRNSTWNSNIFIGENTCENFVCKVTAYLFMPRWLYTYHRRCLHLFSHYSTCTLLHIYIYAYSPFVCYSVWFISCKTSVITSLSALLAFVRTKLVTDGLPAQTANNEAVCFLCCWSEQAEQQPSYRWFEMPVLISVNAEFMFSL